MSKGLGVAICSFAALVLGFGRIGMEADGSPAQRVPRADGWAIDVGDYYLNAVVPSGDTGWIGAGGTQWRDDSGDGWLATFDGSGDYVAQKRFSGPPNRDWFSDIQPAADGGWVICGGTESYGAQHYAGDGWVVKLRKDLNVEWQKVYRSADENVNDTALHVLETSDGGYLYSSGWRGMPSLTKLDRLGNVLWRKTYDISLEFWGPGLTPPLIATSDGGFVVASHTSVLGGDSYLLKVDAKGSLLWQCVVSAKTSRYARAWIMDLAATADGGFITVGATDSYGDTMDGLVMRFDADGNIVWEYRYKGSQNCSFASVSALSDGSISIAGSREGNDLRLVRLSSSGKLLFQKWYEDVDIWPALSVASDGRYLLLDFGDARGGKILGPDKAGTLPPGCPAAKLKLQQKTTSAVVSDLVVEVVSSTPKKLNFKAKLVDTKQVVIPICQ